MVVHIQIIGVSDRSSHTMSAVNSLSMVLAVISVYIEGLTASKASILSDMSKRKSVVTVCASKKHTDSQTSQGTR